LELRDPVKKLMLVVLTPMIRTRRLMLKVISAEFRSISFRETLGSWKNGTIKELRTGRRT
jgi:hypothetical protein